jgi:SAM-dependent methyltransferase
LTDAGTKRDVADAEALWDLEILAGGHGLSEWMFEQFEPFVGSDVVEIGAGIGTYSERLLSAGVERLLLVEPDRPCVARLNERFADDPRVTISTDELPDAPDVFAHEGQADLVVCQNVLEHIEDHAGAVRTMASTLRPGGHLVLLVPAGPRLYGPLDETYGHFRRYTRDVLRSVVTAADLEVEDLYSFNLLGIPGWWVSNRRGKENITPASIRAYEALLKVWRPIERRTKPRWGLSLIVRARRR